MGSGVNPEEINGFLQTVVWSAYSYDHEHGSASGFELGWPPQTTSRDVLNDGDELKSHDSQSERTTESTMTSQADTVRSAAPSSVFSGCVGSCASVAESSHPSLAGPPEISFVQQFSNTGIAASAHPDQILWCEFSELKECPATFSLADEPGWIQHHEHHLRDSYPTRLVCWFCNIDFVAVDPRDAYANFVERMQHVRGHILSDHRWTSRDVRPDFHIVNHLYKNGLLSKDMYRTATSYSELPLAYRLPGSHSSSWDAPLGHSPEASTTRSQHLVLDRETRTERRRRGDARRR